jgi:hypothetical protein
MSTMSIWIKDGEVRYEPTRGFSEYVSDDGITWERLEPRRAGWLIPVVVGFIILRWTAALIIVWWRSAM